MIRKNKGKIIVGIIGFLFLSTLFGMPNYIRYQIEKRFGSPDTFFYGVNVAFKTSNQSYYDEEYSLDDNTNIKIKNPPVVAEYFLYGRYVNSADPLVVILNDKVIYNDQPSSDVSNFYSRYYIEKHFVVELKEFKANTTNKIVISTGNSTEVYNITSSIATS